MNRDGNWIMRRRNKKKKPDNKCSSDEVANCRNNHEMLESDSDDYEENEKKDWEEEVFNCGKRKSN